MATTPKKPAPPPAQAAQADQAATAMFVVGSCPLLHDGRRYAAGDLIQLTAEAAKALGSAVTPTPDFPELPKE